MRFYQIRNIAQRFSEALLGITVWMDGCKASFIEPAFYLQDSTDNHSNHRAPITSDS